MKIIRVPPPAKTEIQAGLEEVQSIYRELAERPAERNCERRSECCQFKLTGKTPHLTRGEALLAFKGFRATGRKQIPKKTDGSCPMLDPGKRCLIYEHRPFGCRTHFCKPAGGPFARSEVLDLIRRLEKVDAALGGSGPESIVTALESIQKRGS